MKFRSPQKPKGSKETPASNGAVLASQGTSLDGTDDSEDYRDAKVQLLAIQLSKAQRNFDEKEAAALALRDVWEGHAKNASEALEKYRDWRDNGDPEKKAESEHAAVDRRVREEELLVELDSLRKQVELTNSRLADILEIEKELFRVATGARKEHDKLVKERKAEIMGPLPAAQKKLENDRKALEAWFESAKRDSELDMKKRADAETKDLEIRGKDLLAECNAALKSLPKELEADLKANREKLRIQIRECVAAGADVEMQKKQVAASKVEDERARARNAEKEKALQTRIAAWRDGSPMEAQEREHKREIDLKEMREDIEDEYSDRSEAIEKAFKRVEERANKEWAKAQRKLAKEESKLPQPPQINPEKEALGDELKILWERITSVKDEQAILSRADKDHDKNKSKESKIVKKLEAEATKLAKAEEKHRKRYEKAAADASEAAQASKELSAQIEALKDT